MQRTHQFFPGREKKRMKFTWALTVVALALAASAGPLDELMPVPAAVEARAGFAGAAA